MIVAIKYSNRKAHKGSIDVSFKVDNFSHTTLGCDLIPAESTTLIPLYKFLKIDFRFELGVNVMASPYVYF